MIQMSSNRFKIFLLWMDFFRYFSFTCWSDIVRATPRQAAPGSFVWVLGFQSKMHEETDGLGDREIETHTLFKFNGHFTPFSNWREKWRFAMLIFAFQLFDIFRWSRRIANRGGIERWHGRGMDHSTTAMLVISHIHRILHSAPPSMSDLSKWTFYYCWVQLEYVAFCQSVVLWDV